METWALALEPTFLTSMLCCLLQLENMLAKPCKLGCLYMCIISLAPGEVQRDTFQMARDRV